MPELPEAETIARTLRPRILGRRILEAHFLTRRVSSDRAEAFAGRTIAGVRRYGKRVLIELDEGVIVVDLRMTGNLLAGAAAGPYTRAVLLLDGATLVFDDVRQFGSLRLAEGPPAGLGPDPLEITGGEFARRLRERDTRAKPLLLNQRFVRGVGNIYADEALFRARIHPAARTRRMSRARAERLHAALIEILEEAITLGGSSVSDYLDADGRKGMFQFQHSVYGRQGAPCPRCGTPIRRLVLAQRGTHFCARCQR